MMCDIICVVIMYLNMTSMWVSAVVAVLRSLMTRLISISLFGACIEQHPFLCTQAHAVYFELP
jgi:hypothetical protein